MEFFMQKKSYVVGLLFILFQIFTLSCSDSKPERLISSFTDDINSTTLATDRVSQMNVYANYDDGVRQNITDTLLWSSSDESIASVNNGLIETYKTTADVTISYETKERASDGSAFYKKSILFSVKELQLTKITLSSTTILLSVGASKQISATGTFEDNITSTTTSQDLTQDCNWSSADINISSVSSGLVRGIGEGNTTITATDSNISAVLAVEVKKTEYSSISIYTQESEFDVEQSITLEARATTEQGERVILESSALTWTSSDASVSVDENIATARSKGSATITATLKEDSSLDATQVLTVNRDRYVRLFKSGVEVEFPYVSNETDASLSETLGTFTLRAVGEGVTIRALHVKDFSGNDMNGLAYFDNLFVDEFIQADTNRTFELKQSGVESVEYYFDINVSNSFKQTYERVD